MRLTEDLTEKLTPEKESVDEELRIKVLEILAESLMLQGDYHLATKKFTQAGDKVSNWTKIALCWNEPFSR